MFGTRKGQGATEYLVLLAVVLIIALVSIALLGFFPGLAGDARQTQSDSYWRGEARPFQILEHRCTGTNLTLVMLNSEADKRIIGNMTVGENVTAVTKTFTGGERKTVSVTAPCGATGEGYEFEVAISYTTAAIGSPQNQVGTKPLIGKAA